MQVLAASEISRCVPFPERFVFRFISATNIRTRFLTRWLRVYSVVHKDPRDKLYPVINHSQWPWSRYNFIVKVCVAIGKTPAKPVASPRAWWRFTRDNNLAKRLLHQTPTAVHDRSIHPSEFVLSIVLYIPTEY